MAENTIGSFFKKVSNEFEKQMDEDLKSFGIDSTELEFLIELSHHKQGKTYEKLAKKLHMTEDKVKEVGQKLLDKKLIAVDGDVVTDTEDGKDLCKKIEAHRLQTDKTMTGMLDKDETLGLIKALKKMLNE